MWINLKPAGWSEAGSPAAFYIFNLSPPLKLLYLQMLSQILKVNKFYATLPGPNIIYNCFLLFTVSSFVVFNIFSHLVHNMYTIVTLYDSVMWY